MRRFLAVVFLGATLAFGASAAFAGEKVDYVPSYQLAQSVSIVSRTSSSESVVAGSSVPGASSLYRQWREENQEGRGR